MKRTVLLLLFFLTLTTLAFSQEADFSRFFTDDGYGSVFVDISNPYARGSIVVQDLMIKKARWTEANLNKKLVAVSSIRSVTGHIEGLILHYEFYDSIDTTLPDADDRLSSYIKDDEKGTVFIRMNDMEKRTIENNFNKAEVINDLMPKKAWWVKNNSNKKIISVDPFYSPSGRIYGMFIYYDFR